MVRSLGRISRLPAPGEHTMQHNVVIVFQVMETQLICKDHCRVGKRL